MDSRFGSIARLTTICATRSATVGTPRILSPPLFFGMGDGAHWRRKVGTRTHSIPDLVEISRQVGLELLERLTIHASRLSVGSDRLIRFVHPSLLDMERFVCRTHRDPPVSSCFAHATA